MRTLKESANTSPCITEYITEFSSALRMVKACYKSQNPNEIMEGQIESWTKTCDLLTEYSYFQYQHSNLGTTMTTTYASNNTFTSNSEYTWKKAPVGTPKNMLPKECSHPGRKPAYKYSKETSPQSPNASGTTNSSTNKEERARMRRASSMTPRFKLGEELKKTSEEKLREKRKPLTQHPHTPPPDLHPAPSPNPTAPKMHKTLPRTSNGTRDYPHPASPTARVNDCPTNKKKKVLHVLPKCQGTAR